MTPSTSTPLAPKSVSHGSQVGKQMGQFGTYATSDPGDRHRDGP
jgi:hypothetical protein